MENQCLQQLTLSGAQTRDIIYFFLKKKNPANVMVHVACGNHFPTDNLKFDCMEK